MAETNLVEPSGNNLTGMRSEVRNYDMTNKKFLDLTREAEDFLGGSVRGLLNVFIPHATAGVALFETGSGSEQDLEAVIDDIFPKDRAYRHSHGSPGHGRDHVIPAFISPSLSIPVDDGRMALGTWQSIVLVDTNVDNPHRQVRFSFIAG